MGDVILREGDGYVSMMAKALQGILNCSARPIRSLGGRIATERPEAAIRNGEDLQRYVMMFAASDGNRSGKNGLAPTAPRSPASGNNS